MVLALPSNMLSLTVIKLVESDGMICSQSWQSRAVRHLQHLDNARHHMLEYLLKQYQ